MRSSAPNGQVADDRMLRARVFAFSICSALAPYGHDESRAEIQRAALAGLERAAEHWSTDSLWCARPRKIYSRCEK
jgi:hypothetical protein